MPEFDPILLSRIQFAFTIAYHIVFPSLSIGLAQYLVVLRVLELKTNSPVWRRAFDFWSRIFALSFGMGVVTGVVLSYEIGTNFGKFSEIAGPVVGPLMSYEVMTAFFLEAGFLGIMLLGRRRVAPSIHLMACILVAVGTLISAFWIISANSFMHTPAGYVIENGIVMPDDWLAAIFNPSFPYRYFHMVLAALISTSFVVAAVGAYYCLRGRSVAFGRGNLKAALAVASVLVSLQIFVGDLHGLNTLEHQPTKLAAIEGNWERHGRAGLNLFAIPDQEAEKNHFEVSVPYLGSLILTHSIDGELPGLKEVPPEDRPPVAIVFFSFRVMVGLGVLMLVLAWYGLWRWRCGSLTEPGWYLKSLQYAFPIGFVAILAGWITTEVGRQPWTVHGLLRTRDAVSAVDGGDVAFTLLLFVITYTLLLLAFLIFVHFLLRKGPGDLPDWHDDGPHPDKGRPAFLGGGE